MHAGFAQFAAFDQAQNHSQCFWRARPKAMVSPAAAACFAIFGEAFRIVACVVLHMFNDFDQCHEPDFDVAVDPVRRSLGDVRNFLTCFCLFRTAPTVLLSRLTA
jgi:hypothetical protein